MIIAKFVCNEHNMSLPCNLAVLSNDEICPLTYVHEYKHTHIQAVFSQIKSKYCTYLQYT